MEQSSVDYELKAEFVNALINKKYPNATDEEREEILESSIEKLDDCINSALLDDLDESQLSAMNGLLDDPDATPDKYRDFFKHAGIDFDSKVKDAMTTFANDFLGGQNE